MSGIDPVVRENEWPERTFHSPWANPNLGLPAPTAEQKHAYTIGLLEAYQVINACILLGENLRYARESIKRTQKDMESL